MSMEYFRRMYHGPIYVEPLQKCRELFVLFCFASSFVCLQIQIKICVLHKDAIEVSCKKSRGTYC